MLYCLPGPVCLTLSEEGQKRTYTLCTSGVYIYSDVHCLQSNVFFLLFKYVPTIKTKELFVESASRPLVGTLMSIGDVTGNIAMY